MSIPKIPEISEAERPSLVVVALLEIIQLQQEQIQALKDEIAQLKGEKPRPKIKPSKLEPGTGSKDQERDPGKRPGSAKRSKLDELEIHETVVLKAESVPARSTFKGYEEYTVQGVILKPTTFSTPGSGGKLRRAGRLSRRSRRRSRPSTVATSTTLSTASFSTSTTTHR
jgi:hypothetical protein